MKQTVDFVIIGAGIAGLYTAYQIKRFAPPNTTFLILEKNQKEWMGGRRIRKRRCGDERLDEYRILTPLVIKHVRYPRQ